MKNIFIAILILMFLPSCKISIGDKEVVSSPPALKEKVIISDYAETLFGLHESNDREVLTDILGVNPVATEWCAAFVNAILRDQGIPGSESVSETPLLARSFLDWGEKVEEPKRGDLVIFERGTEGWQGHVGFFINKTERNGQTYYLVLGGNQGNEVSIDLYSTEKLLGIRRYN
jgi:uncharacterized protein (TIGR02594 family)